MSAHDSGATPSSHADEAKDEPRTPTWLTLLGVALFFFALVAFLVTRPAGKTSEELAQEARANSPVPEAGTQPTEGEGEDHPPHPGHEQEGH
ncbi:MAG TPA: hypothetical protein VI072_34990 [Polyangiaceae bacterium]